MDLIARRLGRPPRFLPFLAWIGEIRDNKVLRSDLVAGITVALVLVPQSMATPPENAERDGRVWRIRGIKEDGTLVMNGGRNVVGTIPEELAVFKFPKLDVGVVLQLLSAELTVSLIGFMEVISIVKAMATKTRQQLGAGRFFRTEQQALQVVWEKLGDDREADCPLNIVCPVTPPK